MFKRLRAEWRTFKSKLEVHEEMRLVGDKCGCMKSGLRRCQAEWWFRLKHMFSMYA